MKLGDRLQMIANEIQQGETMADIGTDHGFLPIYLWQTSKCPKVIMTDISRGSLEKARNDCRAECPDTEFDFRLGSGIEVLEEGEVDAVVIAGMGGLLMCDILGHDPQKAHSIRKYILQPRNNIGKLRCWLQDNGYEIIRENLVREGRYICEILTISTLSDFNRESDDSFTEYEDDFIKAAAFEFPHSLIDKSNELTEEYLRKKLKKQESILENIKNNSSNTVEDSEFVRVKIVLIQKMLKELNCNEKR